MPRAWNESRHLRCIAFPNHMQQFHKSRQNFADSRRRSKQALLPVAQLGHNRYRSDEELMISIAGFQATTAIF
ncbi:unnamed protein product [Haemonchus placei]|uniref:Transposase n=1 Tax=Haemonchus placei TaxID=6290 RepID=A0A0N4VS99_HAEPC|nr:unnamed protein product [Haemonchus placei]